ncbi:MAG: YkgJ family cysteine cluster protein [Lentisphaeria bacterium]|nr:YkgJ family cysteine cluster protein [Lentisphaeria bacterium]
MADPKLHIARNLNYSCVQCGRCCRRFYVALSEAEKKRLGKLSWGNERDLPDPFHVSINGQAYFARRQNGDCCYLDRDGLCRMHAKFGLARKALTCRGYPVNIASTFWGEVSAVVRMDCPAVQQNHGPPITKQQTSIQKMVREMGTRGGFSREEMEGLNRESIDLVVQELVRIVESSEDLSPGERAFAFHRMVCRLEMTRAFLNDTPAIREMLPTIREKALAEARQRRAKRLSPFARAVFRHWLTTVCRRDTEAVNPSVGNRVGRMLEMTKIVFGFGSLRKLGWEHPNVSIHRAPVFSASREASEHAVWDCWRRLIVSRLEAYQFFGVAYYHQPFFTGLKALDLVYPLMLGAASVSCHARGATRIEEEDVRYAAGAIDHTLGRSPLLQVSMWRRIEDFFHTRQSRLLASLGWE